MVALSSLGVIAKAAALTLATLVVTGCVHNHGGYGHYRGEREYVQARPYAPPPGYWRHDGDRYGDHHGGGYRDHDDRRDQPRFRR